MKILVIAFLLAASIYFGFFVEFLAIAALMSVSIFLYYFFAGIRRG